MVKAISVFCMLSRAVLEVMGIYVALCISPWAAIVVYMTWQIASLFLVKKTKEITKEFENDKKRKDRYNQLTSTDRLNSTYNSEE